LRDYFFLSKWEFKGSYEKLIALFIFIYIGENFDRGKIFGNDSNKSKFNSEGNLEEIEFG
jgi:hypothetical protein